MPQGRSPRPPGPAPGRTSQRRLTWRRLGLPPTASRTSPPRRPDGRKARRLGDRPPPASPAGATLRLPKTLERTQHRARRTPSGSREARPGCRRPLPQSARADSRTISGTLGVRASTRTFWAMTETGEEPKRFDRPGRVNEITARANRDIATRRRRAPPPPDARSRRTPAKRIRLAVAYVGQRSRDSTRRDGRAPWRPGTRASPHRVDARAVRSLVTDRHAGEPRAGNPEPLGRHASLGRRRAARVIARPSIGARAQPFRNILSRSCAVRGTDSGPPQQPARRQLRARVRSCRRHRRPKRRATPPPRTAQNGLARARSRTRRSGGRRVRRAVAPWLQCAGVGVIDHQNPPSRRRRITGRCDSGASLSSVLPIRTVTT